MMHESYIQTLNTFDKTALPDLDITVLGALELFASTPLPDFTPNTYHRPLVVGSGNAEATGRILFANTNALFASESNVNDVLENVPDIDEVVIVSASGGKHAPIIAQHAINHAKRVTLLTNTPNSPTKQLFSDEEAIREFVYPKNREPYTYNTSTYLGMILSCTKENPSHIREFLENTIGRIDAIDFSKIDKYYFIVPNRFSGVIRMLHIKFIELFGRNIARDIETVDYVRHATTVVPSDELFVSFGEENTQWGNPDKRLHIPLPEGSDYGAMMAAGYYVIAQIQKAHPPYFKQNITTYTEAISKLFQENIGPIVEKLR